MSSPRPSPPPSPLSSARTVSIPSGFSLPPASPPPTSQASANPTPAIPPPPEPTYEGLPPELREMVVGNLHDLASLCSLMYVSPQTRGLFFYTPAQCVDSNVLFGKGSDIHDLVRLCFAIRHERFQYQNITEFYQECISKIGQNTDEDLFPPIPAGRPDEEYYDIVFTAYRVWCHTLGCLKYYMDEFMELRPRLPSYPSFQYGPRSTRPWRQTCMTYRCSIYHAGAPSGSEEHLVARTLWRRQVEYELQNAISQGRIRWEPDSTRHIFPVNCAFLWGEEEDEPSALLMKTIQNYLEVAEARQRNPNTSGLQQLPEPFEKIPISWPDRQDNNPSRRCSPDQLAAHPQPGVEFLDLLRRGACSPLPNISPELFLDRGFAIWDLQRFCSLGLLRPSNSIWHNEAARHHLYCAWRSILPAIILAENDCEAEKKQSLDDQRQAGYQRLRR